jgi:cytochrome b561
MSASFIVQSYTPASQIIHWLSALLVCLAWVLGLFGDEFPKGALRETANFIHISAGEIIAFLLILRLTFRFLTPQPTKEPSKLCLKLLLPTVEAKRNCQLFQDSFFDFL